MKRKPFLLGLCLGLLLGLAVAVALEFSTYRMMRPMNRLAEAAQAAEYTYLLYLYAPYPVGAEFLKRECNLLKRLAAEATSESERSTVLRDLAASEARLAQLHSRNGRQDAADRLMAEALVHLRDSGSPWNESQLQTFVDELDQRVGAQSATIYESKDLQPN